MGTLISAFVSVVVGGAVAVATISGVVSSQTSTPDRSPASVGNVSIDYGSN